MSGAPGRTPRPTTLVPQSFYRRDALLVAPDLLGRWLCHDVVALRITEVEAYRWPDDSANHCRAGRTARNAPMWGPPGRAYVYLCYGLHHMLNLVTDNVGEGAAVLIRACEVVSGLEIVAGRRKGVAGTALLSGPGRVAAGLGLDLSFNHAPLYQRGGLFLVEGTPPDVVLAGPRIGIDYASPEDRAAAWRFAAGDSCWVSSKKGLRPCFSDRSTGRG